MAVRITQTLNVAAGTVLNYSFNTDFGYAAGILIGPETQGAPEPSIFNFGEMRYYDTSVTGSSSFIYYDGSTFWQDVGQSSPHPGVFENHGLISAITPNAIQVFAVRAVAWGPDLLNSGTIYAEARDEAVAIQSSTPSYFMEVTNTSTGVIHAKAQESALALYMYGGGHVENAGIIRAEATGGPGVSNGATAISFFPQGRGSLNNSGLIEAIDGDPTTSYTNGIGYFGGDMGPIINSGTIRADRAIIEFNNPNNAHVKQYSAVHVQNSGLIEGLVSLDWGDDVFDNSGHVIGDVDLGSENDTYNGQLGTIDGNVFGWDGDDRLNGGAGSDHLFGENGTDTLNGGDGHDWLEGGTGADVVNGGAGIDTASYESSAAGVQVDLQGGTTAGGDAVGDTLTSIESLAGSVFADTLYGDAAVNTLSGDAGDDWLEGRSGGDVINGGSGDDIAAYTSSGAAVVLNLATNTFTGGDAAGDTLIGIEGLGGSQFDDIIIGNAGANRLYGQGGVDTLTGNDGNDTLDGGLGNDMIDGGQGSDTAAYGGTAAVRVSLLLSGPQDTLGAGIDTLISIENLTGGDGNDLLTGDDNANVLNGLLGDDTLDGGAGNDTASYAGILTGVTVSLAISGAQNTVGAGSDTLIGIENLTGGAFNDTLTGDAGNNVLIGGYGRNVLNGGAGSDTVTYAALPYNGYPTVGINVDLSDTTEQQLIVGWWDTLSGIENVIGTDFNDSLHGSNGVNYLFGGNGNDYIDSGDGTGTDWLEGGAGADQIFSFGSYAIAAYTNSSAAVSIDLLTNTHSGGDAEGDYLAFMEGAAGSQFDDQLFGNNAANTLLGQGGNDRLVGRGGADTLDGGAGALDIAVYAASAAAIVVDLQAGTGSGGDAAGDTLSNIEGLEGSAFNDQLFGDANANRLLGNGGADFLQGRGGADNIDGGDGDDWLDGGAGGDAIDGGAGALDVAAYGSSAAAVNLDLQSNTFSGGDAAGDVLTNIEGLSGSSFADQLFGNAGANWLFGQGGADFIQGRGGNDIIDGGDGDDWLDGGAGADQIFGGNGNDIVAYGASNAAVNADLAAFTFTGGDAAGDTYSLIEGVSGSSFGDQLFGDGNANRLFGQGGNDFIQGRGGNDAIDGGDGDDWLDGGAGADQIFGGNGFDVVAYGASLAAVNADLQAFTFTGGDAAGDTYSLIEGVSGSSFGDQLFGDGNGDRLFGQGGNDFIQGRGGNDAIDGGDGDDWLDGGLGADQIFGGNGFDVVAYGASLAAITADLQAFTFTGGDAAGDTYSLIEGVSGSSFGDTLSGDANANRLFGQGGADTIAGRGGNDYLDGGAGNDIFVFTNNGGVDTIADFDDFGDDTIQLSISGITNFAQVQAVMTQSGADVLIDFATTDIVLTNTTLASMGADDFAFV